jgi:hypothetical protein
MAAPISCSALLRVTPAPLSRDVGGGLFQGEQHWWSLLLLLLLLLQEGAR